MEREQLGNSGGQVLVLVALALLVLVGFTAVAVDGGNLYATRRKMQNAADAGALAGARQLCFEEDTSFGAIEAVAQEYASTYNDADEDDVEVTVSDTYTVTVVAGTKVDTLFAGVMGFHEVPVAASASAMCSQANEGDSIWPLAADHSQYDSLSCDESNGLGEYFWVFVGNNVNHNFYCDGDEGVPDPGDLGNQDKICACDEYHFAGPGGGTVTGHLGPADRGWLRLFEPPAPWVPPGNENLQNCGANALKFWIIEPHPGPIRLGDCLPGKQGITQAVANEINPYYGDPNNPDKIRNLILYEVGCANCDESPPFVEQCCTSQGMSYYKVSGFGCIEVVEYRDVEIPAVHSKNNRPCEFDAIVARKRCGEVCNAATGGGSGIPDPDAVRAVRLVD
jgi:hypothetical protein